MAKHYALDMSGRKNDETLKVSKSGVNDFLRAFQECPVLSYPLIEWIANYDIAALVYGNRSAPLSLFFLQANFTKKGFRFLYQWSDFRFQPWPKTITIDTFLEL